ncbi:MAG: SDR family oxidoreductase [Bacteroidetes bacterium]|nr:SDR family oxidoreductase [Bacteroidota bacterium]
MKIIVTGASRGIGYELVKQLSADEKNTVFAISRNFEKLEQLKKECKNENVIPIACDLSQKNSVDSLIAEIKKHTTEINAVVNNAGVLVNKPFSEISSDDLENIYNVNVFAVVRLIQGVLPLLDEKVKSHIVNISSMGGFQGSAKFSGLSAYSSSKASLVCLTECLAEEFKEKNIAFNCLALGAVQTEMLNEAFPGYIAPLSSQEMAFFIADFVINAHKVMNGRIIPVTLSTP